MIAEGGRKERFRRLRVSAEIQSGDCDRDASFAQETSRRKSLQDSNNALCEHVSPVPLYGLAEATCQAFQVFKSWKEHLRHFCSARNMVDSNSHVEQCDHVTSWIDSDRSCSSKPCPARKLQRGSIKLLQALEARVLWSKRSRTVG